MCGSPYIGEFKGTQQIEQVLRKTFPKARVLRMDYDTTRTKGSYEKYCHLLQNTKQIFW
ncbi:MAG: hypothetical protein ACLVB1_14985 [Blautia obeum]